MAEDTNLWRWHHGECVHDSVWILLPDLADQKRSHSGSGTTTEGMTQLESL